MPPATRSGGAPRAAPVAAPDPHPALRQLDPSTAFLYAPHTVSVLLAGASRRLLARCNLQLLLVPLCDACASCSARFGTQLLARIVTSFIPSSHRPTGLLLLAHYGRVLNPPAAAAPASAAAADAAWSRDGAAAGVWAALLVFLGAPPAAAAAAFLAAAFKHTGCTCTAINKFMTDRTQSPLCGHAHRLLGGAGATYLHGAPPPRRLAAGARRAGGVRAAAGVPAVPKRRRRAALHAGEWRSSRELLFNRSHFVHCAPGF